MRSPLSPPQNSPPKPGEGDLAGAATGEQFGATFAGQAGAGASLPRPSTAMFEPTAERITEAPVVTPGYAPTTPTDADVVFGMQEAEPQVVGIRPFGAGLEKHPVAELADGVWAIRIELSSGPGHVNVFVLQDGDSLVLVDTGTVARESMNQLSAGLESIGHSVAEIGLVVITHFHPDHAGLAGWFHAQGAEIVASRETAELTARALVTCTPTPNADEVAMVRRGGASGVELEAYRRRSKHRYSGLVAPIEASDFHVLTEHDRLRIGSRDWRVVIFGGHAPGQVSLWSDDKIAIVGDHLMLGMATNLMVPVETPDYDPVAACVQTCERFAEIADDSWLCLPGHNDPFFGIRSRCEQQVCSLTSVLERFCSVLTRPQTIVDTLEALYGRPLAKVDRLVKVTEATGYVNHLRRRGEIKVTSKSDQMILHRSVRRRPK